jgi:hypothetical protein
MRVVSASAGQTIDLAIYEFLGAGKPGDVLASAQLSTTSSGKVTGTVGTPVVLSPGLYFIVVHTTSTAPTIAALSGGGSIDFSKFALLSTDGYDLFGSGSSISPTALIDDANLPGVSYSYQMDLTGLTINSGNFLGDSRVWLYGAIKS